MFLVQCSLDMELHQLRYLVLLAEELNFTQAAKRANVAQPGLSRQIRKLEDELGVPLVDRTSRRVALTPAGEDLVERARRVLEEVEQARAVARDSAGLLRGRVAIGTTQTPGPIDIAQLLEGFHRRHPGVELSLREDLSVMLADRLRSDELDLAFVTAIDVRSRRRLEFHPIAHEALVLVAPSDHPLAARESVHVRDLRSERMVAFPHGATIRATFERAAATAGFAPHVAFESNDVTRTQALVERGLGLAILPASDTTRMPSSLVTVALTPGGTLTHEVFVAWRAERRLSPAASAFRTLARERAR
jgi:LysR family transcriptional activator of glutamate synthase operon